MTTDPIRLPEIRTWLLRLQKSKRKQELTRILDRSDPAGLRRRCDLALLQAGLLLDVDEVTLRLATRLARSGDPPESDADMRMWIEENLRKTLRRCREQAARKAGGADELRRDWLFLWRSVLGVEETAALRFLRDIDRRERSVRVVALLHYGHARSRADIAAITGMSPEEIEAALAEVRELHRSVVRGED